MLTTIIVILVILFALCVAMWIIGIIENMDEYAVMSLHTFCHLLKNNRVFDIDSVIGVGYFNDKQNRKWVMPHWTWYPIFAAILIGEAFHKDVI